MFNRQGKSHFAILGALILGVSTATAAVPAMAADRIAQAGQPSQNFSDEQLKSYANAAVQVQQVNQSMDQARQSGSDPEEMQQMQQQAYADLERIIQSNGLTVEEYNAIGQMAQTDAETRDKVMTYFEQAQQTPAPVQ